MSRQKKRLASFLETRTCFMHIIQESKQLNRPNARSLQKKKSARLEKSRDKKIKEGKKLTQDSTGVYHFKIQ